MEVATCHAMPSAAVPSYARPTAASQKRSSIATASLPLDKNHRVGQHHPKPRLARPDLHKPRTRAYSSTSAHSKRPSSNGTNFFSLPGELRNVIYEYSFAAPFIRRLDLRLRTPHPSKAIPALLRADPRLAAEASGYHFGAGHFDISLEETHLSAFLSWLKAIDPQDRSHVAKITGVTIRVAHGHCMQRVKGKTCKVKSAHQHFPVASVLAGRAVPADVMRARAEFPAVGMWTLVSECECAGPSCWVPGPRVSELHPEKLRGRVQGPTGGMRWLVERVYGVLEAGQRAMARDETRGAAGEK